MASNFHQGDRNMAAADTSVHVSLDHFKRLSDDRDIDALRDSYEQLRVKVDQATAVIRAFRDIKGWDPVDPNKGVSQAINAAYYLVYVRRTLVELCDWFEQKARHRNLTMEVVAQVNPRIKECADWVFKMGFAAKPEWY
jgi:hypothetical protein